jgi:hypothetical protein
MKPAAALLAAAVAALGVAAVIAAEPSSARPKDQFRSVVYVRKSGAPDEVYRQMHPDTLAMAYPPDFYKWGGKYMYMWFFPHLISYKDDAPANVEKLKEWAADPAASEICFTRGMWTNWDAYRAAGIFSGPKPERFEDLVAVSEEYARAVRDGVEPLPPRMPVAYKDRNLGPLCIANPDAVRLMINLEKFNAAHLFDSRLRKDGAMPVNGGFVDMDGRHGCPMDYSEFAKAKFDAWLHANYGPEQIQAILQADPAKPVPLLTPKGARGELVQVYERMRTEFYYNVLWPEYCRALKAAIESVLGPGRFHYCYHGDGYWWRVIHAYPTNMIVWGDWLDSYCTECAVTPYVRRGRVYYALPDSIEPRTSNVNDNWNNSNNVFDYQYAAGRLWGEPVVLKAGYKGPPIGRSAAVVQLALAEGLALLGNARINAAAETTKDRGAVRPSLIMPTIEFMHTVAPQVRQMIPAARVGVLFCPADSWFFYGFERSSNDTQACQVSNILHAQHVPLQVAHVQILEQTLAQRPMDVLIVPWLRCVKDSHAAVLSRFVQQGGKMLFVGECGTRTWEGLKRQENAFADLLPAAEDAKLAFRQVGKGRTSLIQGALDEKIESAQNLQAALFELLGRTPSCVRPDQSPLLLANLTRNSDNSRFWMHLVNYDVDYDKSDAEGPIHSLQGVRVLVPLPDGLRAKSAQVYRPGVAVAELTPEMGREGCGVVLPRMDIYALIAVQTEPGDRSDKELSVPATLSEAAGMVAAGFNPPPSTKALVPPPAAPPAGGNAVTRGFPKHNLIAYVTSAGDQPVSVRYQLENVDGQPDIAIYGPNGKRLQPATLAAQKETTLSLPAIPGGFYSLAISPAGRHLSLAFAQAGGACLEASRYCPLTLEEPGDSPPLYFYVPRACKGFKIHANTRPFWTPRLAPVRLVVKDSAGQIRLDRSGPMDGGWTWEKEDMQSPAFDIQIPSDQAGRIWSLWLLDASGEKEKKGFVQFWLDGVPPVVASSPAQLLIAKGHE